MEKKTYNNLLVSSAPHIVTNMDTTRIMMMVLIGLAPSFLVSIYVFGARVISLTLVCAVASVFFEWAWNKLMHKRQTIGDLSAVLTGVLIAFNVPSGLPYWIAIVGCFVAIIVIKQLFGGVGKNIANPAITARIVLFISFATEMTTWPAPRMAADATSTATPLGVLAEGNAAELPTNMEMFLGYIGGSMGEVSAIALLIGGLFLIWKKVISPIIPVLHGDRLCHHSVITGRKSCLWYRLRSDYDDDQTVGSVSGRCFLLHPDHELPDTAHRQLLPEENVWRCEEK